MTALINSHSPGAGTLVFRRNMSALALILTGVGTLAGSLQLPVISQEASARFDGHGGAAAMASYAESPGMHSLLVTLTLAALLASVPGVLGLVRLIRPRTPRLALVAGLTLLLGYIANFGIAFTTFDSISWAEFAPAEAGAYLDAVGWPSIALVIFFIAAVGTVLGTLLFAVAVVRNPECPTWAGAVLLGYPVGFFVHAFVGNAWVEVAGIALQLLAFAGLARAILRIPGPDWASRG